MSHRGVPFRPLRERFDEKVDTTGDDCWLWIAKCNNTENTYNNPNRDGGRNCRTCKRARDRGEVTV